MKFSRAVRRCAVIVVLLVSGSFSVSAQQVRLEKPVNGKVLDGKQANTDPVTKGLLPTPETERLLLATEKVLRARKTNPPDWDRELLLQTLSEAEQERLRNILRGLQPRSLHDVILQILKIDLIVQLLHGREFPRVPYLQIRPAYWRIRGFDDMWLLTLPAGFEQPLRVVQLTRNTVWLQSNGNLDGIYMIEADHWKMMIPTDPRMLKHEWTVLNSNAILMTASSTAAGADYTGATLTRIVTLKTWPVKTP